MAVMIPPEFPSDHSSAEHRIYRKLRDETPSDWCALHSVGLATHDRKPWAEVDFVVLTDRVVLCLEVKGGRIRVEHGTWSTNGHRLSHSPFEQAGGGAGALKSYFRNRFGRDAPTIGWGVLFPACRFEIQAPYADPALLFDESDLGEPMHVYLDRLADYWLKRDADGQHKERLGPSQIRDFMDALAPEFSLQPTLAARIHGLAEDFVRMTDEQVQVLRGFSDQPRLLVQGGAGSGKTMLAMAEADRLAGAGSRVLLGCASTPLAADIRKAMASVENVTVKSLVGFAISLLARADMSDRVPDERGADFLAIHLPELALEALEALGEKPFGAIVIDEGQDLIQGNWLEFFDGLVEGGLESGVWRFFHDPNQDILLGTEAASLERLEDLAESRYRLTRNCRNTRQIATSTAVVSGLETVDRSALDGPDVEQHFYVDSRDGRALAASVVKDWISDGVAPGEIVVLSSERLDRTVFAGIEAADLGAPIVAAHEMADSPGGVVRFSTIEDFKGLESDAILILDVRDLDSGTSRLDLYVAMTRAKTLLCVMLDRRVESHYDDLLKEFNRRVLAGEFLQG